MISFIFYSFRRSLPFLYLAIIAGLITAFLLRNLSNWDYPLSGEFFNSPFNGEIMRRSLNIWDEHFGLGFSNLLNGPGEAPYANVYSGAMWVSSNVLNSLFQWAGATYFFNYAVSFFLFSVSIYLVLCNFRVTQDRIKLVVLSLAIAIVIQSTDFFIDMAGYANRFLAGQSLILIALIQYRNLLNRSNDLSNFLPIALCLSTLLLVFSSYYLALLLFFCFQGLIEFLWADGKRIKIVIFYAKLIGLSVVLILLIYGYVIIPPLLSQTNLLMSGPVGRHDSPMMYQLIDLLSFFNKSTTDHFGLIGSWLLSILAFLGIILATCTKIMRRRACIDTITLIMFLFLAKGSAYPFPEVNHWLHVNIPFLRLMGSGYAYFGVVYALLIFYFIYGISRSISFGKIYLTRLALNIVYVMTAIVLLIVVFRNDAYLSGDFGGRVQSIEYPEEYYAFKKVAENNMQVGRAYYFPDEYAQLGIDYIYSPMHSYNKMGCCFSLPFSSTFPVNINWSNFKKYFGYYGQTMAFLMSQLQNGEELARVLSNADTRYLVFDLSVKESSPANDRMLARRDQVRTNHLFEFIPKLSNNFIEVYENKLWRQDSIVTKKIILATDDANIFMEAARIKSKLFDGEIVTSSTTTLTDILKLKNSNLLKKILLYNSDELGLMLDLTRLNYELKPDPNLLSNNMQASWSTYNSVYQIQDTEKNGGKFFGRYPIASTSDGGRVSYSLNTPQNTTNRLFIRAFVSPDSGMVNVYVNDKGRPLNLRSNGYMGFQWFDLGDVENFSNGAKVEVEAKDAGYLKRIDVVSLVPIEAISDYSRIIRELFLGVGIERIEKTQYINWKKQNQQESLNSIPAQFSSQITPKKLMVRHHNFSLNENFDRFDSIAGKYSYNLIYYEDNKSITEGKTFGDKNFSRTYGGPHQRFIASAIVPGVYSIGYELVSCEAFSDLTLSLKTAYVSPAFPIHIYISENAKSWIKVVTLTSDYDNEIVNLNKFVNGKKKAYLKISYEKVNKDNKSVILLNLKINGVAGAPNMNCNKDPNNRVKESYISSQVLRSDVNFTPKWMPEVEASSTSGSSGFLRERGMDSKVLLANKAFDPNWRMGDSRPFNAGYGFAAFKVNDKDVNSEYLHEWEFRYRILQYCSLGIYLLLWVALIWNSYKRIRRYILSIKPRAIRKQSYF
jgi:hypothetical protein